MQKPPVAALDVPARKGATNYPEPFARRVAGRCKRKLGEYFALQNFGVNLTTLEPGAVSALAHHHLRQDEFVYVLDGELTLLLGEEEHLMRPGDCIGLPAGSGIAHQLINRSRQDATYLEIGDHTADDQACYPKDDLEVRLVDGSWVFTRRG